MSELKPAREEYICRECRTHIAPMFEHPKYPGIYALSLGGLLVESLDGLCVTCGAAIHFRINSQMLRKLVRTLDIEELDL